MADATAPTLKPREIMDFFGYAKLADFSKDWKALPDEDKAQIRAGLIDGTYNY